MYDLLKKHRRRLLAIATALLMVAFLLPSMNKGGSQDYPIGTVNGRKVNFSEVRQGQYHWNLLRTKIFAQSQQGMMPVAAQLGDFAVKQIDDHPELFMLLVADAHKQGIYISDEVLQEKHQNLIMAPDIDMKRIDVARNMNAALRDLLMVEEAFNRALSAIRISEPLRDREIALRLQQVKLAAVDFRASDFTAQVQAPTPDELQQQFAKYKDTLAPTTPQPPKDNPFGFGYRYPDRVQIQYIMVPTEEVRRAVEASKPAERWRIDARRHYMRNPGQYSTTTRPAGTTQPVSTTRPFQDVAQDALDAVIMPEADKLQASIVSRINATLAGDWNVYRNAKGAAAATSLNAPFNTYEYVQRLSDDIQKQFNVRLTIGASGGLLSASQLTQLGQIARASTGGQVPFVAYATMTDSTRKILLDRFPALPPTPELWQPSQVLRDPDNNAFVFRRTAFEAEHSPANLEEVVAQVEKDVRTLKAFELAKAAAEQFAKIAAQQGLANAAAAIKKPVVDTGLISRSAGLVLGLNLSDSGTRVYAERAIETLLEKRAGGEQTPIAAVPVQKDGRVIVTRLDEVKADWDSNQFHMLRSYVERNLMMQMAAPMQQQWFAYDNVSRRVGYQPSEAAPQRDQPEPPAPPRTPLGI